MGMKYNPRPHQQAIHNDPHRYRVVVWHRRAGKSTMAVNEVLKHARKKKGRYWIIYPTFRQAKTVMWKMLHSYLPKNWVYKMNETLLEIILANGSEIALKGCENKDSLLGVGLRGVVFDEFQLIPRSVWTQVIRPTIVDTGGWAMFIGTPRGKNQFFELYQYGEHKERFPDWKSWHLSAETSGLIPQEELETLKKESTQAIWESEWLAEFIDSAGSVFRRIKENATSEEREPDVKKVYRIGVDLARLEDFTVISVIDRHSHAQVYLDRFNQLEWGTQRAKIESVARRYNNAELVVDATGVGDPVVEELIRLGLAVVPFKYTTEKKKLLIENLAKMLESDRLRIIPNEQQLQELETFTYTINPETQRYRYNAPEGLTDDIVNALALSVWDLGDKLPEPSWIEYEKEATYFKNPYG